MRFAFIAAAAVLTVSIAAPLTASPAAAQKKAAAQLSVNECIDLARKRGYTESDFGATGGGTKSNPARNFVIRCLQGKQR